MKEPLGRTRTVAVVQDPIKYTMAQKVAISQASKLLGQVAQCEVDKLPGELGGTADGTTVAEFFFSQLTVCLSEKFKSF